MDDQATPDRFPASHKESFLLPTKLACPDKGQLGPAIQGYLIDFTHTPYQLPQPPPIQLLKEKCYGVTGGKGTPDKGSNSGDHSFPNELHVPNFSG